MLADRNPELLPVLAKKPELFDDLVPYYSAFLTLSTSRQTGFGLGYIPYSEIIAYLNEERIFIYNERLEYINWILKIDKIYVNIQHEKQNKESKQKQPAASPSRAKKGHPISTPRHAAKPWRK